MTLQTLHFWEIIFDITQICLCGLIILFLILNRIKFKRLILRAPSDEQSHKTNAEFVVEAARQQTELAFQHIIETIEKERQTLDAYYHQHDPQMAPAILESIPPAEDKPNSGSRATDPDPVSMIYGEIERLADQGLSLTDISERLNVPQGEVDLVLKLKHLSTGAVKKKILPPA
ncbi:MAG: hypothetical protein PVI00_04965 [Desulfobacterales bacterium]|jgi:hypothetical protein